MARSSDENSTRGGSTNQSTPESTFSDFPRDTPSRARISAAERAQIWAVLSGPPAATAPSSSSSTSTYHTMPPRKLYGVRKSASATIHHDAPPTTTTAAEERSKLKKFGTVVKRIFMNEQTIAHNQRDRRSARRDSWDDIYRSKDNAKIRPIHEEYGVL